MRLGRGWTSASALVFTGALCAAPAVALAQQGVDPAAERADPAAESYKQHMSNGVKLFQDKNYAAAIVEFQAAYAAKPKASPLINIALCHKGLFHYPKAVAALREALTRHGNAMEPGDKKATEEAIAEMSALLAYVTVRVSPDHAVLSIDGEDQPPGSADKPIPLGPGPHRIAARASGHASAEASLSVASGDKSKVIALELVPDKGFVRVRAPDRQTAIAIDQKPMGRGSWEGYVAPGRHVVQVYKGGVSSGAIEVLVSAGKAQEIAPEGSDGELTTRAISAVRYFGKPAGDASIDAPPELALGKAKEKAGGKVEPKKDPALTGFYGHAAGSFFGIVAGGPMLESSDLGGWSFGVRGGYRLSTAFGVELMLDYSNTTGLEEPGMDGQPAPPEVESAGYDLDSIRFGTNIRFMTPGYRARFVATLGLGFAHDTGSLYVASDGAREDLAAAEATTVYFNLEQGVEFNLKHVLLGLVLQQVAGTTGRFVESADFGGGQVTLGLGLRVGYGRW
jgi:hypothetical protein